jgi:hypothetical protein
VPGWINDRANQEEWNGRFIRILNRDYGDTDSSISAMLRNEKLAQTCGVKIRSYVDKPVTVWLYRQRKARGAIRKKRLETAIVGLNAAIGLYVEKGDSAAATMYLDTLATELSRQLRRCKEAYATKRHGRDRAHSTLSECRSFLESKLGRPVTYVTLANLVNAGFEADGNLSQEPVTEEHLRKNLAAFNRNNPLWRNEIDPRFVPVPIDPETK